jgi:hypothetical protein
MKVMVPVAEAPLLVRKVPTTFLVDTSGEKLISMALRSRGKRRWPYDERYTKAILLENPLP